MQSIIGSINMALTIYFTEGSTFLEFAAPPAQEAGKTKFIKFGSGGLTKKAAGVHCRLT
ncbi:hypothetical protein ACQKFG_13875 [Peribacillus sp. NPDC076916]|uniref:hypothetical protein n=1 Tax=Peribacillus sp. NPDC076916 TaxID=3390608 RepID=UPI003D03EB59